MTHDLVIRGGTVIDGSGQPGRRADVAIADGRIVEVGRCSGRAARQIDAEGLVVTPGFVDGHTHMDAQVCWDGLGVNSCWHGVTTVVMGNTGFTLAPSSPGRRELVVRNLERAEDIPATAMGHGIDWAWESFPEYLDFVEGTPKGVNYAAYVGHSALRTWAMGERAFSERAEEDDLRRMRQQVEDSLAAGAVGLSTSRSPNHLTADDRPVASRLAEWQEVLDLTSIVGRHKGMVELAHEPDAVDPDPAVRRRYRERLKDLALSTGASLTFGVLKFDTCPDGWREMLDLFLETEAAGGTMFGQSHSHEISTLMTFETKLPFDHLPVWREVRAEPAERQLALLADPELVARLVASADAGRYGQGVGAEMRPPDYDRLLVLERALPPNPTVAEVATHRACHPVKAMIDLAVETQMGVLFAQPLVNDDPDAALEILRHPSTVMTFSDSGAHISQIVDANVHTYLLGWWVRERAAFDLEEAVAMITSRPAARWGLTGRGRVTEGYAADLNVLDPATVGPAMPTVRWDLPGGAARLEQRAEGIRATLVAGEVLVEDGAHTGAMPGRLLRRRGTGVR